MIWIHQVWRHNILKAKKKNFMLKNIWTCVDETLRNKICVPCSWIKINNFPFDILFFFSVVSFQLQIAVEIMSRPMARLKKSQQPVTIQSVITLEVGKICTGYSMICSDIWRKYHEWYFKIVIHNLTSCWASVIWDNFEISRVVFMPNITYKSCYYLFILLPTKSL